MTEKASTTKNPQAAFTETLLEINSITTRIDEKVQNIVIDIRDIKTQVDNQFDVFGELNARVKVLESRNGHILQSQIDEMKKDLHKLEMKLQLVESSSDSQDNRWKTIMSFGIQLLWVITAGFLLYKLGIQAPAVP